MRLKHLLLTTTAALALAVPATAQDAALFLGNEDYDVLSDVRRGDEVADLAERFRALGFEVNAVKDGLSDEMADAAIFFERAAEDADRLLVVLAGRFVHSANDTFFLSTEARPTTLMETSQDGIALSQILAILEQTPGRAVLALGHDDQSGPHSSRLTYGIGALDIPQGVTVISGPPRTLRQMIDRVLAEPGADMSTVARARNLAVTGYLASGQVFLETAPEPIPEAPPAQTPEQSDRLADLLAWRQADQTDTIEGYQTYLDTYPRGQFTRMAQGRIDAMTDTPEARAERSEQALDLNRDQRREIQRDLSLLDYNTRGIDGIFGRGTRTAIGQWQTANNFEATGYLTGEQITRLDAQAERRAAELEEEAERRRLERLAQDQAFWEETGAQGDEAGYRAYLNRFPDGEFSDTARTALEDIERQNRADTDARDRQLWDEASMENTAQAYRDYLVLAPNGAFRDEAESRIAEIERAAQQSDAERRAIQEENALNLTANTRRVIESRLERLGLEPGRVDGTFDDDTRRAIRRYQSARNLDETGYLSEAFVVQILADSVRSIFR